ncbi:unnamed protein product [Sympodiomycopsis kandeliae]
METLGPFGSGLAGTSNSNTTTGNNPSGSTSSTPTRGRGSRGGRGGRGSRGGRVGPVRPPIIYGPETGRKKPGPKPKSEKAKLEALQAVKNDAKETAKTRGGGRGGGRGGRGKGRGRGRKSVTAGLDRESTLRRSESEMRSGTATRGRSPTITTGTNKPNRGSDDEYDEYDDEDFEDDNEDEGLLDNLGEEEMKWRQEMEKLRGEAMGPLVNAMSSEQYDRHEAYRRAGFNKVNLRRLLNTHLGGGGGSGSAVHSSVIMAFNGVAKVFVGEIIEGARRLCPGLPDGVPIPPTAIMESYRLYSARHSENGALAKGRGNPEMVHGGSALGGGMGGKRRLF